MKEQYKTKQECIVLKPTPIQIQKKKIVVLKSPSFQYQDNFIEANLSLKDKGKLISSFKEINITKKINFAQDINQSKWLEFAIKNIKYFHDNNISNTKIKAYGDYFEINATCKDKKSFDNLQQIINSNNSFKIKNNIKLIKKIQKKSEKVEKIKKIQKIDKKKIQKKVNLILKKYPVYFKFNSDLLTLKSKKTLDKILNTLKSTKAKFKLEVEGHSNAVGNKAYNKRLSQKRAESVKSYLIKHYKNIKIHAKGYGSEKPFTKNPKDKKNRRVEIIIIEGLL
jgi:outer membrane protein OmpA-like peptidoglycan-associated protein